jgi:type I restriction enzyme M protein
VAKKAQRANAPASNGGNLGFEAKLWAAADAWHNNMDAAGYKHVVLGFDLPQVHLRRVRGEARRAGQGQEEGRGPEDPDEYRADNIFWVPPEARWAYLKSQAPQPTIGQLVDDAMTAIERDNTSLKGNSHHPAFHATPPRAGGESSYLTPDRV